MSSFLEHVYPQLDCSRATIYLSIDIGIRNFAYCVVAFQENEMFVLQWENIDLLVENGITKKAKYVPMTQFYRIIHTTFSKRLPCWQCVNRVLVEQQIGHSRNAKLEGMVCMWLYTTLQKPLQHVPSRHKLGVRWINKWSFSPQTIDEYKQRKVYTVKVTRQWLQTQPPWLRTFFASHDKQDDLADVLLQAVACYIK